MSKRQTKKFNKREVVVVDKSDYKKPQANQWQATEQQLQWLEAYMNPRSDTYANAYESAIQAGYSHHYARQIMSNSLALQWVQSAKSIMRSMNTAHLTSQLEEIINNPHEQTKDRLTAIKMLGTDQGMFVQKNITAHVGLEEALSSLE